MTVKQFILLFLVFFFVSNAFAQKFSKAMQGDFRQNLEEARTLKFKDPAKAILLLEEILEPVKRKKDLGIEAEAFMLLGDIYENQNQQELALQRFLKAEDLFSRTNNFELLAQAQYRIGRINLKLKNYDVAENYFDDARSNTNDLSLIQRCQEGKADVAIAKKNYDEGLNMYSIIQEKSKNEIDSVDNARIEAKKADVFVSQNRIDEAQQSYYNSANSLPRRQLEAFEYEPLENVNFNIQQSEIPESSKIDFLENSLQVPSNENFPKEAIIENQLQLADLYSNSGNFEAAEKHLNASKDMLTDEVSAAQKAKVYKKVADLNAQKGAYELALQNHKKYSEENEKAILEKETELNQLIAVLKGQKKIDLLEKDFTIEETESALLENQVQSQKMLIGFLTLLLVAALISFYFIIKNVNEKRQANQLLLLKSLRTQMNPHFIFNALNSVNNFISKSDERAANKFLSDFSKLMRVVLENSQKDFIPASDEIELLELYLKLEHLRFKDKFDYKIINESGDHFSNTEIPPMLIQPFIENAIWHGLRYKKEKGQLNLILQKQSSNLLVIVEDNGIGRKQSKELKTENQKKYKSTGLENVKKRIDLINQIYSKNYLIEIEDLKAGQKDSGTRVKILIPE